MQFFFSFEYFKIVKLFLKTNFVFFLISDTFYYFCLILDVKFEIFENLTSSNLQIVASKIFELPKLKSEKL